MCKECKDQASSICACVCNVIVCIVIVEEFILFYSKSTWVFFFLSPPPLCSHYSRCSYCSERVCERMLPSHERNCHRKPEEEETKNKN